MASPTAQNELYVLFVCSLSGSDDFVIPALWMETSKCFMLYSNVVHAALDGNIAMAHDS